MANEKLITLGNLQEFKSKLGKYLGNPLENTGITWSDGYGIKADDGVLNTSTNFKSSSAITLNEEEKIIITLPVYTLSGGGQTAFGIAFYNSENEFVSGIACPWGKGEPNTAKLMILDVPSGASYFKTTYYKDTYSDYIDKYGGFYCFVSKSLTKELIQELFKEKPDYKIITFDDRILCDYFGIQSSGAVSSANFSCTSFIPVVENTVIECYVMHPQSQAEWGYAFYDENKDLLEFVSTKTTSDEYFETEEIEVPEGAKYFRTTFYNSARRKSENKHLTLKIACETDKLPYQNGYFFYSSNVNQAINKFWLNTADTELDEDLENTTGVLALPTNYTPNGKPTPLIMYFHGYSHGVWYDTWGATDNFRTQKQHWLNKGFAVMDCNGGRNNNKQGYYTSGGSRQYTDGYRKCFEFVKQYFNVEEDIYVVGGSAGGIPAINYVHWYNNVKALCLLSAWSDLYTCSWGQGVKDTIVEYLGFTDTTTYEIDKTKGFDPALRIITIDNVEYLPMQKVPVMALIGSTESSHVLYTALYRYINALRNAGQTATIREITGATHAEVVSGGVQYIDDEVANWFIAN